MNKSMESYIDNRLLDYKQTKVKKQVFNFIKTVVEVSQATFYRACGVGKPCSCNGQGMYTRHYLKKYLLECFQNGKKFIDIDDEKKDGDDKKQSSFEKQEKRENLEIRKLEILNEDREWSLEKKQGKYIQRSELLREIAARILLVANSTGQFYQEKINHIIEICDGDHSKAEVLLAFLLDEFNAMLAQASSGEMIIIIDDEEDD